MGGHGYGYFILGHFVVGHMMVHGQNTGGQNAGGENASQNCKGGQNAVHYFGPKIYCGRKKSLVKACSRICVSIKTL